MAQNAMPSRTMAPNAPSVTHSKNARDTPQPQPHQRREDEEVADRGRGHGQQQHDGEEVRQLVAGEQEHQEHERRRDNPGRDVDGNRSAESFTGMVP